MLIVGLIIITLLLAFCLVNLTIVFALGSQVLFRSNRFWRTVILSALASTLVNTIFVWIDLVRLNESLVNGETGAYRT